MDREFFDRLGEAARAAIDLAEGNVDDKGADCFDPVTDADRMAEKAMRALIEKHYPGDGICGEEYGWVREGAERHWSLDPIDGTRAFICGLPNWAVLAGVVENGEHIAGMIDLPDLDERLVALGGEAWRNDERIEVSDCRVLLEARLSTTDPYLFEGEHRTAFERLLERVQICRFGLDAFAFARVATGDLDLATDIGLQPHDYDAIVPIVRAAGGHVGNWSGGDDLSGGDVIAAATRSLYHQAVDALGVV